MPQMIRRYYGFQFFFSLLVWLPIFYEYQHRVGLSDGEIFSIQSVYYIAFALLEIPTGLIADRWGYLRCLRIGALVLALANLLPIFAVGYNGFMVHFLLIALARSLISGASSAYLYDSLAAQGATDRYKQIEGNARAYGLIGKVVFWAIVGFLMTWHMTLPYWLTAGSALISFGFAAALPAVEKRSQAGAERAKAASAGFAALVEALGSSPMLVLIMVQGIAIFVLGRIVQVNLYQPILGAKGFDLGTYGIVMAVMTVFEAAGSARPELLKKWFSDLNAVFVVTCAMALCVAVVPFTGQVGTLVALCLFSLAAGLSFPVQRQLLNDWVPDARYRATLLSCESIIDRSVCAAVAAMAGGFLARGQLDAFLQTSATVTLLGVAALWFILRLLPLKLQKAAL